MKAKLSKEAGGYDLYRIDEDGKRVTFASTQDYKQKLSLKNCQAIERGYDLDDCVDYFEKGKLYIQQDGVIILAGENGNNGIIIQDPLETRGVGHYSDEWNPKAFCEFKQKALEILGDKKFSEEQLRKAFFHVQNEPTFDVFKKSLQQTEWDCIVEMEYYDPLPPTRQTGLRPKLDAENCLILKRL